MVFFFHPCLFSSFLLSNSLTLRGQTNVFICHLAQEYLLISLPSFNFTATSLPMFLVYCRFTLSGCDSPGLETSNAIIFYFTIEFRFDVTVDFYTVLNRKGAESLSMSISILLPGLNMNRNQKHIGSIHFLLQQRAYLLCANQLYR
jgi:hypothetical protein